MIYFFQRSGTYYRVETHSIFELHITGPDGTTRTERFSDEEALAARERALHREFHRLGWEGPHGRSI